jgi:putative ABC transport system permease protein
VRAHRILALIAYLVPLDRRQEWLAEWQAEFRHKWTEAPDVSRSSLGQYLRCLGAIEDALWLRLRQRDRSRLSHDLRYATRTLRRNPGFTAVVVITLALGVGANAAIFSLVSGVLLEPLPYHEPERLVTVWEHDRGSSGAMSQVSPPNYADWKEQAGVFSDMSAAYWWSATLTGGDGAELVLGAAVTPGALTRVLGIQPVAGRGFVDDDGFAGARPVVILSRELWTRRFGEDPAILGATVELNGVSRTVVGIMPAGFEVPTYPTAELWRPLTADTYEDDRSSHYLRVIARLRSGATVQQARTEMNAIMAHLEQEHPEHNANTGAAVVTLERYIVRHVERALWVLFGAVGFVLILACANVANLMLARASVRDREFAVRSALGAGRRCLIRQAMTESLLLTAMGGAAGLLLAHWAVKLFVLLSPSQMIPRLDQVGIDVRVLLFMLALTVMTGLAFGVMPTRRISRADVADAIRDGARGGPWS